ncbi:hypothetical protein EFN20_02200 [Propionibacterium freudenreichii]|nr:hypothetical protein [Propionibacterium freudenreichii]MCT2981466.1 hypothetical protein [Propionibacterium freudenreichii]MCT2983954.1 hypothetical protein [Propionibacterium freudenreichii]MCT2987546.1 hypothetical protein [Propionibacterium freudenreichii]MCT3008690.1 hypothetical protein [Propionibacterium freudenreichii]
MLAARSRWSPAVPWQVRPPARHAWTPSPGPACPRPWTCRPPGSAERNNLLVRPRRAARLLRFQALPRPRRPGSPPGRAVPRRSNRRPPRRPSPGPGRRTLRRRPGSPRSPLRWRRRPPGRSPIRWLRSWLPDRRRRCTSSTVVQQVRGMTSGPRAGSSVPAASAGRTRVRR